MADSRAGAGHIQGELRASSVPENKGNALYSSPRVAIISYYKLGG